MSLSARADGLGTKTFEPRPGSQQLLVDLITKSDVEEIYYCGEAGGGKTHGVLGVAREFFRNALIFRRKYVDLTGAEGMIEASREIYGRVGYQSNDKLWRLTYKGKRRYVAFAGCENENDKFDHAGRPHDLYAFDEITQFPASIPDYVTGWLRTPHKGQRLLKLFTGNAPVSAEGDWVTERVRPWVDKSYPRPAKPGEIRWFVGAQEVEGPEQVWLNGRFEMPVSRTFLPSVLSENPTYAEDGRYARRVEQMPEPFRSALKGDFFAARRDNALQVIPTAWIQAAQARWTPEGGVGKRQTCVGVDVAGGGEDRTVFARRWDTWFARLEVHPGTKTPLGSDVANLAEPMAAAGGFFAVDKLNMGASSVEQMKARKLRVVPVNFSEACDRSDATGLLSFANMRAACYWTLRDALNPEAKTPPLALPPGLDLQVELAAARLTEHTRIGGAVQLEDKKLVKQRLGRSPDLADAVALTFAYASDRVLRIVSLPDDGGLMEIA